MTTSNGSTTRHVFVVEPRSGAEGHFASGWVAMVDALTAAGAECTPVLAGAGRGRLVDRASPVVPALRFAVRAQRRVRGRASWSTYRHFQSAKASRIETPVVREAVRLAAATPNSQIVIASSYGSTPSKQRLVSHLPTLEFLSEPAPTRAGLVKKPTSSYVLVATTRRIADSVRATAGWDPPVLSHLPIRPPRKNALRDTDPEIRGLVADMKRMPTVLVFGAMHGKKDLDLVSKLPALLPADWLIVVAGAPLVDGQQLYARLRSSGAAHRVRTIERSMTDAEIDALVAATSVVLAPQRRGEASTSGALLHAIGAHKPVVAPEQSSAGDAAVECRLGAVYDRDRPLSIREAIETAVNSPLNADARELTKHGLLTEREWGKAVLAHLAAVE